MSKYLNIGLIIFVAIFFSACSFIAKEEYMKSHIEKWYIDTNNKKSKILRGSTKDYATTSDNYIVKYFDHEDNEIPKSQIKRIKLSDKWWNKRSSEEEYGKRQGSKKIILYKLGDQLKTCIFDDDYSELHLSEGEVAYRRNIRGAIRCKGKTREMTLKEYDRVKNKKDWDWRKDWVSDWEKDPNKFYYIKNENGEFIKDEHLEKEAWKTYDTVRLKECFDNGYCEIHIMPYVKPQVTYYVRKNALEDIE